MPQPLWITAFNIGGAEGETRTRTAIQPLDPEPSASTNSATSAQKTHDKRIDLIAKLFYLYTFIFIVKFNYPADRRLEIGHDSR